MKFEEIKSRLQNVKKMGAEYSASCPAHEDKKPSLSLSEKNGNTVLYCHAGCSANDICHALGIKLSDLFGDSNGNGKNGNHTVDSKLVCAYQYRDEAGELLYENVRYEEINLDGTKGKTFRQRRFDGDGRTVWGLNGTRRVPYRLPELIGALKDDPGVAVFLCEGEKDADNLRAYGFTASSFKNWKPEFNTYIKGANVVLLIDHDDSGFKLALSTADIIRSAVKTLKMIDLFVKDPMPAKHGKDVSDWLEMGHTANELKEIVEKGAEWQKNTAGEGAAEDPDRYENEAAANESTGKEDVVSLRAVRLSDVRAEKIDWLWEPFLAIGTFNLLEGEEGIGKTFLVCALACAIAHGRGLPVVPAEEHISPLNVLLISAEDSLPHVLKPRLESMDAPCDKIIAIDDPFTLDQKGLLQLSAVLAEFEPKLVVIDPIFSYTGKINLDRDSDIRSVTDELKRLAERHNCCIVGIRHIGKSKGFGDARNAGLNGVGWRASARSVLLIGKNPENEHEKALCQTKNNLAQKFDKSIGFEIKGGEFFWTGESELTAQTMLSSIRSETSEEKNEKNDAMAFLREVLHHGERAAKEVQLEARQAGISEATLRRAKTALNVKSRKKGGTFGGNQQWFWFIEDVQDDIEDAQGDTEDAQINNDEQLPSSGSNKTSYCNNLAEDAHAGTFEHLPWENEHLQVEEDMEAFEL